VSALDDDVVDHLREMAEEPDLSSTKYELIRKLDSGGMGSVYLVKDTALGREVALKVVHAADPSGSMASRLLAEARHLARLEHPNIVPVHDVGSLPGGRVYCAMKLVRGRRLDEWRKDPQGRPGLLRLFQRICGAVAFAHAQGVMHRDLKPENIMVGSFGEALVMDWGVAKLMGAPTLPGDPPARREPDDPFDDVDPGYHDGDTLERRDILGGRGTAPGAVIGTPAYMSPEQARGEVNRLDERTDVYALGAILFFLLSGRPPYEGGSARELLEQVRRAPPPPLRRLDASIPKSLEAICARAMAPAPGDRYASAQQMSDDIERFLDGEPVHAHPENFLERALRLIDKHRVLVWLLAAYVLMRMTVLILTGR